MVQKYNDHSLKRKTSDRTVENSDRMVNLKDKTKNQVKTTNLLGYLNQVNDKNT